jgi:hypothetical protein
VDEGEILEVQALRSIERLLERLIEQGERNARLREEGLKLLRQEAPKYAKPAGISFTAR